MHIIELGQAGGLTEFEGQPYGAGVSVIVVSTDVEGAGPRLHRHPYPETFVIRGGRARFTVGDQTLIGTAGQVIVVPADTPHKFAAMGPDRLEMVDVHASDHFITEWLE
jgi:mannose-6-phosphate isomerase-like protein (cupin superfamily)